MLRKVKFLDEVKKLLIESSEYDLVIYNNMSLLYPKNVATVDHFIVRDDAHYDKVYNVLEPHLYKGLNIWKCHTAPYNHFEFTINDEVFE